MACHVMTALSLMQCYFYPSAPFPWVHHNNIYQLSTAAFASTSTFQKYFYAKLSIALPCRRQVQAEDLASLATLPRLLMALASQLRAS